MRLKHPLYLVAILPLVGLTPLRQLGTSAWEKPIAPGLVYRFEVDRSLPRQIHALRVTPARAGFRWRAELAGGMIDEPGTTKGRSTPTEIAAKTSALAVVNGDFFSFDHGAPVGITVRDGELLHTTIRPRAVFAWGPRDTAIGMPTVRASIVANDTVSPLDHINQPQSENGFVLYTSAQGMVTPREGSLVATLSVPNVVWAPTASVRATVEGLAASEGPITVSAGKAILVASGSKRSRIQDLTLGQELIVRTETTGFNWEKFDNAIGGGPTLLKGGQVAVDAVAQGFNEAFSARRHPRTAIGRTAEGDVWVVAIDGRQAQSVGATLEETAVILKRLGCVDAINLDGGGSTALNVRGLTVNMPSDANERPVSNAIVFYAARPPETTGRLRLNLDPKVAPDGTIRARVDLDGKPVPEIEVLWTARGNAWIDPTGKATFLKPGPATIYAQAHGQLLKADIEWRK